MLTPQITPLGPTVEGKLVVTVDKPKKYQKISVKLWGRAKVHWQEGENSHHRNLVVYVENKTIVWTVEDSPTGELPAGEHHFPFSFQLPHDTPPSFECRFGGVRYSLQAKVNHQEMMKLSHTTDLDLNVTPESDVLSPYQEPKVVEKSERAKFLCMDFGSISASASIPRTGFSPGEAIPISISVDNQSSKSICVLSTVKRVEKYHSSKETTKLVYGSAAKAARVPVQPGQITSYEESSLVLPEVAMTVRNVSCINIEYFLAVEICIPWASNFMLVTPLIVASGPSTAVEV